MASRTFSISSIFALGIFSIEGDDGLYREKEEFLEERWLEIFW